MTYYPGDPSVTVYQRRIYVRVPGISVGLLFLAGGAFIIGAGWSSFANRKRLRRMENDPLGSLRSGSSHVRTSWGRREMA